MLDTKKEVDVCLMFDEQIIPHDGSTEKWQFSNIKETGAVLQVVVIEMGFLHCAFRNLSKEGTDQIMCQIIRISMTVMLSGSGIILTFRG